ncbi:UDP-N-acetylmuramoylalanyl-D-glutamate--2,6-diaminopimelate ligase [hydrothermal vent metagenome]|uniref:UDP-N-acetylmuramoylalanyl-D-glutamate--2,6-diaminopimelate ligase n=1 Tax=hydrothermal vent metagenome TaxID=652676 RepID=A0A3B0WFB3_9ZZZZ
MKMLDQLVAFLGKNPISSERVSQQKVLNLSLDSRQIRIGDAFIALQGEQVHGLDFLANVLPQQPAIIFSDQCPTQAQQQRLDAYPDMVCLVVEHLAKRLADLANWFYDQPSQRIKVVGVTGTNGKTSVAFYTAQLLNGLGQKTALMGTLGNGVFKQGQDTLAETVNTTPDVVTVHRLLAEFIQQNVDWVIMEVSSHALELGRVDGVVFDTVALTQVTRDHIDFHGSLNAYQDAKKKLFTDYPSRIKVLNASDAIGKKIIDLFSQTAEHSVYIWCYTLIKPVEKMPFNCELCCPKLILTPEGMLLELTGTALMGGGEKIFNPIFVPLMGAFNAENVLCALSIILASDLNRNTTHFWDDLVKGLSTLQASKGRMQLIELPETYPTVMVDFAHTPDALQQVLFAVKQHLNLFSGRLWVVFGCGGDRDFGKRPLMAKTVESLADCIMVTSDNPRFEAPEQIIQHILSGFKYVDSVNVVLDRQKAIEQVLALAKAKDVVFIAGKGHESYQNIKGVKIPFQDEKIVLNWVLGVKQHGKPE